MLLASNRIQIRYFFRGRIRILSKWAGFAYTEPDTSRPSEIRFEPIPGYTTTENMNHLTALRICVDFLQRKIIIRFEMQKQKPDPDSALLKETVMYRFPRIRIQIYKLFVFILFFQFTDPNSPSFYFLSREMILR
jgi:hypothetical protein